MQHRLPIPPPPPLPLPGLFSAKNFPEHDFISRQFLHCKDVNFNLEKANVKLSDRHETSLELVSDCLWSTYTV